MENFANVLSAGMSNLTEEEYVSQQNKFLTKLDFIEQKAQEAVVNSIEDYKEVIEIKDLSSSLWCYAFNNKKEEFDRVDKIERILGTKLYNFAKKFNKLNAQIRPIAKYLCWNKRFYREDIEKIIKTAFDNDIIRKRNGSYYIIGFHLAVGDNTFSISRRTGQEYRDYVKSFALQAISISFEDGYSGRIKILNSLPIKDLEDYYTLTSVGNHKHCVKINFNRNDKSKIYADYFLK